jgi:hypothetical protein
MVTFPELGSSCAPPGGLVEITVPAGWLLWTNWTVEPNPAFHKVLVASST